MTSIGPTPGRSNPRDKYCHREAAHERLQPLQGERVPRSRNAFRTICHIASWNPRGREDDGLSARRTFNQHGEDSFGTGLTLVARRAGLSTRQAVSRHSHVQDLP